MVAEKRQTRALNKYIREQQLSLFEQKGIPITPEHTAPMNNYLARSSLFAPIKRGKRSMKDNTILTKQDSLEIRYTGPTLDMADHGVFLEALRRAAGVKPHDVESDAEPPRSSKVIINRAEFLEALGRNKSGKNYKFLEDSFRRLFSASLSIKYDGVTDYYHLIGNLRYDENSGCYYYVVPLSSFILFADNQYGYINMLRRKMIGKRINMAQWLQSYFCSHAKNQPASISLAKLKGFCGYAGSIRDFRTSIRESLEELLRIKELSHADLDDNDIVRWVRV